MAKSKLYICKDYHIQPSEIMALPYYEFEIMLEEIKQIHKEQEEENKRQEKESAAMRRQFNPNAMMKGMNNPMQNMQLPKVNIPKF